MNPATDDRNARTVYIRTFGCQMNAYDSGKLRALLAARGYRPTDEMFDADVILVNTCSVRDKAEQKVHGFLSEAFSAKRRRRRPTTVAVAGCVAQQEGRRLLDRYPELDLVFGPDSVPRIVEMVEEARAARVLDTDFLDSDTYVFTGELDPAAEGQVSDFVTIQKGCDNKCTFCVVPATRGPELSRPSAEIVAEVEALVARGVREVTLIGQNVNSYGIKVPGELTFARLLARVARVRGLQRIRFTTSHPRDMGPDVVAAFRDIPAVASHLHLPVQSGSDAVLRRMKRFTTRKGYLALVDALRAARPDLALTTDFIVGFPGETDADFEATLSMLDLVGFAGSFSFKYSPRPGTAALRLLDRGEGVPPDEAQRRLAALQDRQRALSLAAHRAMEGAVYDVLVEGPSRHDAGVVCGRTSTFRPVNFPGGLDLVGRIVPVRITRGFTNSVRGEAAYSL